MKRLSMLTAAVLSLACLSSFAFGDTVTLSDGSRLVGVIHRLGDGKLTIETQFAGVLELDASQVTSVSTDQPVHVGMDSGDRLVGAVEWSPEADRAVVQTQMGPIPVDVQRIQAVWPEGAASPEELAFQLEKEEIEKQQPKWSFVGEVGAVYKEGNTDSLEANGRITLERKSVDDLLRFYIRGAYSEKNDVRDTSEVIGGAYYEHLINHRLYAYGRGELEYDEFESLDLRSTTTLGLGYYWIKEDNHELKNRVGVGYRHESYMDGATTNQVIADLGLDYRVDIAPWLQFTHAATYTPSFEEFNDYLLQFDTALLIPLKDDRWKIKTGVLHEYDNHPAAGIERLDTTYYTNLQFSIAEE